MSATKIKQATFYVSFVARPLKFAVQWPLAPDRQQIDVYRAKSYPELVRKVFEVLSESDADLLDKLSKADDKAFMKSPHKTRRYVSEHRDHLYINAPHLTRAHSSELKGYWYVTNIGRVEAMNMVSAACKVAGVERKIFSALTP